MSHRKRIIVTGFLLLLVVACFSTVRSVHNLYTRAALTFSTTQEWDPEIYKQGTTTPLLPPTDYHSIVLTPPPSNTSPETRRELETLHRYAAERDSATLARIMSERSGEFVIDEFALIASASTTETEKLIAVLLPDLNALIVQQKAHFDRVRPSILDTTLTTAIDIPGHPAYPSGHSTQTHFLAHVYSYFDPIHTAEYFALADSVARNREIAGVHYPSDSAAGAALAEQYFAVISQSAWWTEHAAAAKKEWSQ